jgi:polyisoprenoid-binding protein YceI
MKLQREDSQARIAWIIDPAHTTVHFSSKVLFFKKVEGHFTDLAGAMVLDEADLSRSSVEVTVKAASLDTGNKRRDAHLRSAEFLDVEKYPDIRFKSTSVERGRDRDAVRITGSLTIKDRSREVVLEATIVDRSRSPQGEEVAYYWAAVEIDRFDFAVDYGRLLIARTVRVSVNVQALRQN